MVNKENGITVTVNVKMSVDESTANGCLKIVEMYLNQTGGSIRFDKNKNGEVMLEYEPAG